MQNPQIMYNWNLVKQLGIDGNNSDKKKKKSKKVGY